MFHFEQVKIQLIFGCYFCKKDSLFLHSNSLGVKAHFCDFPSPFHMLVASQSNLSALVLDTTLLYKSGKSIPEGRVTTAYIRLIRKTEAVPRPSRLLPASLGDLALWPVLHVLRDSILAHLCSTAPPVLLWQVSGGVALLLCLRNISHPVEDTE